MNKEIMSEYKPVVVLTPDLVAQIQFLHSQCPKGKEWSGLLMYQVTKGSVTDLANLEIRAVGLFPMDFGDASFTSFEAGQGWMDCFKQYPQVDPFSPKPGWYIGKIHSHHTMGVFHSSTDVGDLHTTAPNMPMFLSVIVNYACQVDAELAIAVELEESVLTKTKWKLKGWLASKEEEKEKKETPSTIYRMKCESFYEQSQWLIDEVSKIPERKKVAEAAEVAKRQPVTGFQQGYSNQYQLDRTNEKKKKTLGVSNPIVYKPMFDNMAKLLTLGSGSQFTPYAALLDVNKEVMNSEKEMYKKAFKTYFTDVWKEETYLNKSILVSEIREAILQFLSHHESVWIVPTIEEAVNELKDDYYQLRPL